MTREGIHEDLDEATYHADPDSLSVTGAKVLLRAPALYKWQREHPVHKDVFDFGSAAHRLVLGSGPDLAVIDADSWRAKAAKEARDEARAQHKVPILTDDHLKVQAMAAELRGHRLANRVLSTGKPEVSAFCVDSETGVRRRSRFDWAHDLGILADYKTAASSEPNAFLRSAAKFGYHMQAAWYFDIASDLDVDPQAFAFVVQEKEPPYLVTVIELPADLVAAGRERNRRALQRFRDCTESGIWPGYIPDDQFATPTAPAWALQDEEYAA